jgi:hypothetical protein
MRRLIAFVGKSRRRKLALLLGAFAATLAATSFGAYAAAGSSDTINACAKTDNGQLRLDTGGGCLPSEQALQWNKTGLPGPPGPPGNTDSTVRHISNFMADGTTVSTPIVSARGEAGKLSLRCGSDANGGNGEIRFTQSGDLSFQDRVIFYSPQIPSSPTLMLANPQATFPWANAGDNIVFEIMIEAEINGQKPVLTDIHGFVLHFSAFGGCSFYVHVNTSEINSGEMFTP